MGIDDTGRTHQNSILIDKSHFAIGNKSSKKRRRHGPDHPVQCGRAGIWLNDLGEFADSYRERIPLDHRSLASGDHAEGVTVLGDRGTA